MIQKSHLQERLSSCANLIRIIILIYPRRCNGQGTLARNISSNKACKLSRSRYE